MDTPCRPRFNRRHLLAGLAAGSALFAASGCAALPAFDGATLELVDRDTGQVLPSYSRHDRTWVPGRPGARYALRLRNHGHGRLLVVLSVDGVNVISGQTADWSQTGYVLDPGRHYDITGWRKSDTAVAAFEFAPSRAVVRGAHRPARPRGRDRHGGIPRTSAATAGTAGGDVTGAGGARCTGHRTRERSR
jgi:hypothetical protein